MDNRIINIIENELHLKLMIKSFQKRLPVKEKTVACTHMVTASKLKFLTKSLSQSNYIDLFSNFIL